MKQMIFIMSIILINTLSNAQSKQTEIYFFSEITAGQADIKILYVAGQLINFNESEKIIEIGRQNDTISVRLSKVLAILFNNKNKYTISNDNQNNRSRFFDNKELLQDNCNFVFTDGTSIVGKLLFLDLSSKYIKIEGDYIKEYKIDEIDIIYKNCQLPYSDNITYNPYGIKRFIISSFNNRKISFFYAEAQPLSHERTHEIVINEIPIKNE